MTATSTAPVPTPSPLPRPLVFANPAHEVVGRDERIPLLDGRLVRYVNLDNAASTPAFRGVVDTVQRFLPYASSVHRGSGYKSRISTAAFEDARARVGRFVGADPERDVVLFAKNTTEAINKLAIAHDGRRRSGADNAARAPLERTAVARRVLAPARSASAPMPTAPSTRRTSTGACASTRVVSHCSRCRAHRT